LFPHRWEKTGSREKRITRKAKRDSNKWEKKIHETENNFLTLGREKNKGGWGLI